MHNIILKSTKKTVKSNFVNPKILGLSTAESWDFGIGKFPGSRDSGIPGLQSLYMMYFNVIYVWQNMHILTYVIMGMNVWNGCARHKSGVLINFLLVH